MSVKYLVSGGEGALGKFVISMLLERGEKIRILMSELSDTRIYRNNPNIEICYGISTDKDSMKEFFELEDPRSCVLFHTDEYVSLSDATNLTMRRVNVIGAENVVDMCLKRKIGKLVYLSSAYALNPEVTGDNLTIHFDRNKVEGEYAKSKAEAAAYVMEKVALNKLNAVMVLPTFIIGPGYSQDYEINKVLNSFINNGTTPPKEGGRAFVDVRVVANAMLTLADKGEPGAGYIISGEYKTSGEFFKDVNDIKGIDAPVKTASKLVMSKSLVKLVNFYYKITHKENPREAYTLFRENPDARFEDNSKGILPENVISFKESLSDTISGAQTGGTQAASATVQQATPKSTSAAEAMEARLKRKSAVASTSKPATSTAPAGSASATSAPAAPSAPAHTRPASSRPASFAAQAAAKARAEREKAEAEKAGTSAPEAPKADAPVKSIIPSMNPSSEDPKPEAPKAAEPVKSIIPQMPVKPEAPANPPASPENSET
ncbi:MAG: NAD-dependent epimerase/dehydratase family protein [Clostridiales bacterium]|nr:NAD-dependent epimerase/dehydratase family protein [Clostridiales bacterium]